MTVEIDQISRCAVGGSPRGEQDNEVIGRFLMWYSAAQALVAASAGMAVAAHIE